MTPAAIDIDAALARMAGELQPWRARQPVMIGIYTGGVWIARQLHARLGITEPLGTLDISFYRDDFSQVGVNPQVKASKLPLNIDDRHIVLVDDVLQTGRTVRAALNEIFDYGRPASVALAALIERDGRELPIEAQVVGEHLKLSRTKHVKLVGGPDKLELEIQEAR